MRVRFYPITDDDGSHSVTCCAEKILFSGFNGSPDLSVMFKTESSTLVFLPRYPCNDQIVVYDMRLQYDSKKGFQP